MTASLLPFPGRVVAVLIEHMLPRPARVVEDLQFLAGICHEPVNSAHSPLVRQLGTIGAGVAVGDLICVGFSAELYSYEFVFFAGDLPYGRFTIANEPPLDDRGQAPEVEEREYDSIPKDEPDSNTQERADARATSELAGAGAEDADRAD